MTELKLTRREASVSPVEQAERDEPASQPAALDEGQAGKCARGVGPVSPSIDTPARSSPRTPRRRRGPTRRRWSRRSRAGGAGHDDLERPPRAQVEEVDDVGSRSHHRSPDEGLDDGLSGPPFTASCALPPGLASRVPGTVDEQRAGEPGDGQSGDLDRPVVSSPRRRAPRCPLSPLREAEPDRSSNAPRAPLATVTTRAAAGEDRTAAADVSSRSSASSRAAVPIPVATPASQAGPSRRVSGRPA